MPNIEEMEVGNWFIYVPENCFCTIKSMDGRILVEGTRLTTYSHIDELKSIIVTRDILSVCMFIADGNSFTRTNGSGNRLTVFFDEDTSHLVDSEGEIHKIHFLHRLQNTYFRLTGEKLSPNIYGIHYPF